MRFDFFRTLRPEEGATAMDEDSESVLNNPLCGGRYCGSGVLMIDSGTEERQEPTEQLT